MNRSLGMIIAAALAVTAVPAWAQTTLKVRPFGDLKTIDPMVTSDYMVRNHGYMIYDTLFAQDEKGAIKPQMVQSFATTPDGLTWTFVLRDDLKFHDGAAVTAADVVASLKRWGQLDGLGQQLTAHTASLEAVDAKTVKLTLRDRWGLVLEALGKPSSMVPFIMPERIAKTPTNAAVNNPTGSGPFMMKRDEWSPGSKVVYVKAPTYVPRQDPPSGLAGGKVANVDRVEWVIIPDAQTALNALQAGEIDIFEEIPPDMMTLLKGNAKVGIARLAALQGVMRLDPAIPPFNNAKLRQAMLHLVDQEQTLRAYARRRFALHQLPLVLHVQFAPTSPTPLAEARRGQATGEGKRLRRVADRAARCHRDCTASANSRGGAGDARYRAERRLSSDGLADAVDATRQQIPSRKAAGSAFMSGQPRRRTCSSR